MAETIYELSNRMCNSTICEDCPLKKVKGRACLINLIRRYKVETAAEQLEVLRKWAEEHPAKTYKNVFLEKLPNAMVDSKNGLPNACRKKMFGGFEGFDNCVDCIKCWNEPYKEE